MTLKVFKNSCIISILIDMQASHFQGSWFLMTINYNHQPENYVVANVFSWKKTDMDNFQWKEVIHNYLIYDIFKYVNRTWRPCYMMFNGCPINIFSNYNAHGPFFLVSREFCVYKIRWLIRTWDLKTATRFVATRFVAIFNSHFHLMVITHFCLPVKTESEQKFVSNSEEAELVVFI